MGRFLVQRMITSWDPIPCLRLVCPKDLIEKLFFNQSEIYPGTERNWRIYVPAQYDPAEPAGLMVSPDHTLLIILDTSSRYGYSYQIQNNGSLAYKQKYYHLHRDDNQTKSGGDGLTVDVEGRVYFTTHAGLQFCDQPGRVHQIWEKPQPGWLSNAVFGAPK